jgi:O-antigen/teichoic acid export membrane protein
MLKNRLYFLFNDSMVYGSSGAISKGFAFLTFPILARHLGVSGYGVYDYILMLSSFMVLLCVFGQDSSVARHISIYTEQSIRRQIVSQSLLFQGSIVFAITMVLWIASTEISDKYVELPKGHNLVKITLVQIPFLVLINFSQNILKWTFQRGKFLAITIGFTVFHSTLLCVALLFFDAGIDRLLFVGLISNVVFGITGLVMVRDWLVLPKNFKYVREMFSYATPLGLISVVSVLMPALERTIAAAILGSVELGLLAAGSKIAMFLALVANAFHTAWGPFALSIYTETKFDETCNLVLKIFSVILCFLSLVISGVAPLLISPIFGEQYFESSSIVFPLTFGFVVQAAGSIVEVGITISGKSYYNIYSYLCGSLVGIVSVYLMGVKFGLIGVAVGVMVGHTVRTIISALLARKAFNIQWDFVYVIAVFLTTFVFGICAVGLGFYINQSVQVFVLIISSVFVLFMGGYFMFDKNHREQVLDWFGSKSFFRRKPQG